MIGRINRRKKQNNKKREKTITHKKKLINIFLLRLDYACGIFDLMICRECVCVCVSIIIRNAKKKHRLNK